MSNIIKVTDYHKLIVNTLFTIKPEDYPLKLYIIKGTTFERAAISGNKDIKCVRNIDKATHIVYANLKRKHICNEDEDCYYKLTLNEIETINVLQDNKLPIIEVNVLFDYVYKEEDEGLIKERIVWNKNLIPYFKDNMEKYRFRKLSTRETTILNKYKNCIYNAT